MNWLDVYYFIAEEVATGESKGYPKTLIRMIGLALASVEIILPLVEYLQDPENRARKVCLNCGREFYHTNQFVKTCSVECHKKWLKDPNGYLSDKTNVRSTLHLINEVECEEKI